MGLILACSVSVMIGCGSSSAVLDDTQKVEQSEAVASEVDAVEVTEVEDLASDVVEQQKNSEDVISSSETEENQQVVEAVEEIKPTLPEFSVTDVNEYTVYSTSSLNLRSGGTKSYDKVGSVSKGSELVVTGKTDTDWLRVKYNDGIAYCSAKYTSVEKPNVEPVCRGIAATPSAEVVDSSPYNNVWVGEGSSTGSVCKRANEYWIDTPLSISSRECKQWKYKYSFWDSKN